MRKVMLLAVAALTMGAFAGAELSEKYKEWPKGPAGFLLTKKEKKEYAKLTSDDQAQAFIDLFWARRDPDLETAVNEFKVEFDRRVEYADAHFGYGKVPGSLSDRGHTLIVMGPWAHRSALPPGEFVRRLESEGEANTPSEGGAGAEVWVYRQGQFPGDIKADQITFIFLQSRIGLEDYLFARSDSRTVAAMRALNEMPEALLLHPNLKEVPKLGMLRGSKAATPADLAVFAVEPRPWPEGAAVRAVTGVQTEAVHPLWVFLQVPQGVPGGARLVGRVRRAGGGDEGTFVKAMEPVATAAGHAWELALPVGAGKWLVDLALVGAEGPVAVTTVEAEIEALAADATYISPFIWGIDVRQDVNAHLGDPFNVGGWHVLPNVGDRYTAKDSVSYFCYVVRPGLVAPESAAGDGQGAEPQPNVELLVKVSRDDKVLGELPPQKVNLSKVYGDVWMFGNALPLTGFRQAGSYVLEVTLRDAVTGVARSARIPLVIGSEGAS